ncbi:MAG: hypothetical protein QOJ72_376, partial [Nocardioidaceae bacterium]|nr:hypothetical protein [Nocardioidaceae bacterium]
MIIEQLSSLLDDTAALETWSMTDAEIRELTRTVHRARAGLDELAVRLAATVDDRGLARDDGCTSTTAWLAQLAGISRSEAARHTSLGRFLNDEVEVTRVAWAAGEITTEQAGIIIRAIDTLPDWIGTEERHDAQTTLLEYASQFAADDLRRLANRIVEVIDPDGADEIIGKQLEAQERKAYDQASLHLSNDGNGLTRIKGQVPTVQGDMLRTVLEGLSAPRRMHLLDGESLGGHGDAAEGHPDHAHRMGRALLELIEHLPKDALPQAGGPPATMTVAVDLGVLRDAIGRATISTGGEMSASQARRFACNAELIPMVMDGSSRIIDMSMAKRLHDRYQRVILGRRDGGCCWKGCDRPPAWCEAHHLVPYDDGGPTTVDNGALFCFVHHHLLHDGDWHARLAPDGIVEVIPPARVDRQQ